MSKAVLIFITLISVVQGQQCSKYEEYSECGNNICQNTCGNPTKSHVCKGACISGCVCIGGYLRNVYGRCVHPNNCGCKGDPNAVEAPCGDPCPITCDNMRDPPKVCMAICIMGGCKCKNGFVLNPFGLCVRPRECPKPYKCGPNEYYDSCPAPCPPEETCKSFMLGYPRDCPLLLKSPSCTPTCRCRNGYVRNDADRCVLPKKCCEDPNAELKSCPNPCPGGTCETPPFLPCRRLCVNMGCQCKKGYYKISATNPKCVHKSECPHV